MRLVVPTSRRRAPLLRHYIGDAEGAADLDQLAARNNHLACLRQRIERQQYGGRVIVDDGRGFGASQHEQVLLHHPIPIAAAALFQVVFEIDRRTGGEAHRFNRLFRQHRAAEVAMDNHAAGINYRSPGGTVGSQVMFGAPHDFAQHRGAAVWGGLIARRHRLAQRGLSGPHDGGQIFRVDSAICLRGGERPQTFVDRRHQAQGFMHVGGLRHR